MHRRLQALALALVFGANVDANAQSSVRLFDLTTAQGIVDEKPFMPTRVFAPGDATIYLWFRADGCTAGMRITSVWFYLEADPPIRFAEGAVTVARPDDWGQFNFTVPDGKVWSLGEYRIELRIGEDLLGETRFRVAATPPSDWAAIVALASGTSVRVESVPGTIQQGQFLSADDEHLTFTVANRPVDMSRAAVRRVHRVSERNTKRFALRGLGIGAAAGGTLGAVTAETNKAPWTALMALGWGAIGATIGAINGLHRDRVLVYESPTSPMKR